KPWSPGSKPSNSGRNSAPYSVSSTFTTPTFSPTPEAEILLMVISRLSWPWADRLIAIVIKARARGFTDNSIECSPIQFVDYRYLLQVSDSRSSNDRYPSLENSSASIRHKYRVPATDPSPADLLQPEV